MREPPERANTWSMSNYPSWQVTLAIINLYLIYILEYRCTDQHDICLFYFRASSVPCLNTNCTVGTRARHTYIVCTHYSVCVCMCTHYVCVHIHSVYTYTHTIVWALTMLENGTSDTCRLIAWTIDLLSNILWEGRLLKRPKQLKIINHKVNKTMHSTECFSAAFTSCFPLMKPWRAPCIKIISFLLK